MTKVLLVDDEPLILSSLLRMLRRDGFELHVANNVFEAIHIIVSEDINVDVTDYCMPPPDGLELLRLLRKHRPNIIGVLMTGDMDLDHVIERALEGTTSLRIGKPWSHDEFRAVLNEASAATQ